MANAPEKPRELKPWDRRPWPGSGDLEKDAVYAGVGRAPSLWEGYDAQLGLVFSFFVTGGSPNYLAAFRAYSAVRTFDGRTEMLRASSEAYFSRSPNDSTQAAFKSVLREAKCFSPIRNEIAHGLVDFYRPEGMVFDYKDPISDVFGLFPNILSFKERNLSGVPSYSFTSVEFNYFSNEFHLLQRAAKQFLETARGASQATSTETPP